MLKKKSGVENVREGVMTGEKKGKKEGEEMGMDVLGEVGLEDKGDSYPIRM